MYKINDTMYKIGVHSLRAKFWDEVFKQQLQEAPRKGLRKAGQWSDRVGQLSPMTFFFFSGGNGGKNINYWFTSPHYWGFRLYKIIKLYIEPRFYMCLFAFVNLNVYTVNYGNYCIYVCSGPAATIYWSFCFLDNPWKHLVFQPWRVDSL